MKTQVERKQNGRDKKHCHKNNCRQNIEIVSPVDLFLFFHANVIFFHRNNRTGHTALLNFPASHTLRFPGLDFIIKPADISWLCCTYVQTQADHARRPHFKSSVRRQVYICPPDVQWSRSNLISTVLFFCPRYPVHSASEADWAPKTSSAFC